MLNKNFEINSDIYPENLILEAINDFKDVSNITYSNNSLFIEDENPQEIFNELINYITALYNQLN